MVKSLFANARDYWMFDCRRMQCLIPGSGRSPREGNDNLLEYSCLENIIDRGALWATVHGVAKS